MKPALENTTEYISVISAKWDLNKQKKINAVGIKNGERWRERRVPIWADPTEAS